MLENPCITLGEDRCKFYTDIENPESYGHCLIFGRQGSIERVRDRFGKLITPEQIKWFNENCIDYPSVDDIKKGHLPPTGCGFTFGVIDG